MLSENKSNLQDADYLLQVNNALLSSLVESSDDAIISKSLDGTITSWNKAAETMFGYSANEIIGKPISLLVPKEGQEEFASLMEKIKQDQRIKHFETERIRKDGSIINVSVTLSPIKSRDGKIIGLSKIVRNISERRKNEEERIKLASIVESSDDAILAMDLNGKIVSWNRGAVKMFGYEEKELMGKSVQIIYPSERTDELIEIIHRLKSGSRIEHFETERKRKDGVTIDVSLSISPIKNKKGEIIEIAKIIRDISGQKRTSAYARSLIEASLDPLVTISLDGKITDVNEATVKVTGTYREELIGSDFSNYFTEPQKAREGYERVFKEGFVTDYPLSIRNSSGTTIDVLYNASVYKNDKGKVLGVFAAARDITETKKVSQYARSLIEASLDPLVTISPDGKITDVNEATVKVTGVDRMKLIGSDFSNYFTEPEEARDGYERVFKEGFVTDYPLSIKHLSGQIIDVLYNASGYKDNKGNVLGVFAAARDITERKNVEKQLHTTFAYSRSLIEASLDPLVTISPDGKITDVNEATVKVTGVAREWLIGTDFSNYFTEPSRARQGYRLAFKEGIVKDYPLTIHHSSGTTIDVLYNASVYKNDKGKVLGVFAAARDVTETKKVSQYARSLIEASLDPLVTISLDGKITDVNEATVKVTGVDRMKLIGSDFSNYFTEPQKAREGYERVFKEGFVTDYPLTIHHSSGTTTDVLYNASVYKNDKGKVLGAFAAARNATRVRQKDEFSTMLTHELKTPLAPIIGYCKMFTQSLFGSLTEEQIDAIHVIEKNARRLEVLINDIMDARKLDMGRMKFKIEDISLDEFFKNLDSSYKLVLEDKGIKFVTKLLTNGITIQSDETRIRQVLDNIISNSINAVTKDRGLLIEIHAYKQNNKLIISIRDNGCGIPLEKQQELFKKFYQVDTSLRRRTGGTGLGLAISRGIMEKLGGSISIESDGKTGTTVHLTLPMNRSIINNTEAMI